MLVEAVAAEPPVTRSLEESATGGADQSVLKRRELVGFAIVKKRPHPWDTHYQFSTKTLLSTEASGVSNTSEPVHSANSHCYVVTWYDMFSNPNKERKKV